jgi:hypothetical protein
MEKRMDADVSPDEDGGPIDSDPLSATHTHAPGRVGASVYS